MKQSEYYSEKNVEQKNSITSGAFTIGVICTVITLFFALLKLFGG